MRSTIPFCYNACSWHLASAVPFISSSGRISLPGSSIRAPRPHNVSYYISCSVPRGSALGPILFVLYTADLISVIESHGLLPHKNADDSTQVYGWCRLLLYLCRRSPSVSKQLPAGWDPAGFNRIQTKLKSVDVSISTADWQMLHQLSPVLLCLLAIWVSTTWSATCRCGRMWYKRYLDALPVCATMSEPSLLYQLPRSKCCWSLWCTSGWSTVMQC